MMYDFELYTCKKMGLTGAIGVFCNSVVRMAKSFPKERHSKVYSDNKFFFKSISLTLER